MRLTTALRTSLSRALGRCAAVTTRWAARLATPQVPTPDAGNAVSEGVTTGGPPAHWMEKVRVAAPHLLEPAPPMTPPRPAPTSRTRHRQGRRPTVERNGCARQRRIIPNRHPARRPLPWRLLAKESQCHPPQTMLRRATWSPRKCSM